MLNNSVNPVMVFPSEKRPGRNRIVVANGSQTPYVAISHVWADGVGSDSETGLPTCRVWKMATLAAVLVPSGVFWLDALCVPKDPAARRQALKLMGRAYREATAVLVLDKTIQSVSSEAPIREILARILTSPWMRRLWTLQEAVLAKTLYFQLADNIFSLSLGSLWPHPHDLQADAVVAGLAHEVHRFTKLQTQALKFADVARSLRWRSTSRWSDEFPAIVSLLGIYLDAILSASAEGRMAELLSAVGAVRWNIPFMTGPKLDMPGFRWAPSTFMSIATGTDLHMGARLEPSTESNLATVTPEGLVGEYLVYEFATQQISGPDRWTLVDAEGKYLHFLSKANGGTEENYECNMLLFMGPHRLRKWKSAWRRLEKLFRLLQPVAIGSGA